VLVERLLKGWLGTPAEETPARIKATTKRTARQSPLGRSRDPLRVGSPQAASLKNTLNVTMGTGAASFRFMVGGFWRCRIGRK
jgi:hypothetical protein